MPIHAVAPIPAAMLIRVSTAGQAGDEHGGLDRQRASCEALAARHGLHIVHTLDLVISGTRVERSPGWADLMRRIAAGEVRAVIAEKIDRLTRPRWHSAPELDDLAEAACPIFTLEGVHTHSGSSLLMTDIHKAIAGAERREIARRASEAKEALRKRGRWTGGMDKLPLGLAYDRRRGVWSYTPEVSQVVAAARRYVSEPISLRQLAIGIGWGVHTLRDRLTHTLYRGVLSVTHRITNTPNGKQKSTRRDPADVIRVQVLDPPAIDADLANRIDAKMARRARDYDCRSRRHPASADPTGCAAWRFAPDAARASIWSARRRGWRAMRAGITARAPVDRADTWPHAMPAESAPRPCTSEPKPSSA